MSRNAHVQIARSLGRLAAVAFWLACLPAPAADLPPNRPGGALSPVVVVEDLKATSGFQPNPARVQAMLNRGITNFTGKTTVAAAWSSVITTQDVVGIKVFSGAGMMSGTRPDVVAAVIHGLLEAGLPPQQIVIWDKHEADLRAAGFFKLAKQLGVRAAGSAEAGYDPTNFYQPDSPIIGNLVWGDLEFGRKSEGVGRRSFVSKLVSRQITKIISVAPLLNENNAGVCGHLYGLAMGSVDNTRRFADDPGRLCVAVPEIYALSALNDRVALNVTDALIGQYEGSSRGLLHYSTVLDQIWISRDPVALDVLAVRELDRERRAFDAPAFKPNPELYTNAALLQLGVNDPSKIQVEQIQ